MSITAKKVRINGVEIPVIAGMSANPPYNPIMEQTTTEETTVLEIAQSVLREIQKRDFLVLITTPTSPAAGNVRFNATGSKSSTVVYNTLNGAISASSAPSVTYLEVSDNGGLWRNESGTGINMGNVVVYTSHLRKIVQSDEYINRLYATATTSGVPFPAGTEIKVYAR